MSNVRHLVDERFAPPKANLDQTSVTVATRVEVLCLRLFAVVTVLVGLFAVLFGSHGYLTTNFENDFKQEISIGCVLVGLATIAAGIGIFRYRRWAAVLWVVLAAAVALLFHVAFRSASEATPLIAGVWLLFCSALASLWLVQRAILRQAPNLSIERTS